MRMSDQFPIELANHFKNLKFFMTTWLSKQIRQLEDDFQLSKERRSHFKLDTRVQKAIISHMIKFPNDNLNAL